MVPVVEEQEEQEEESIRGTNGRERKKQTKKKKIGKKEWKRNLLGWELSGSTKNVTRKKMEEDWGKTS